VTSFNWKDLEAGARFQGNPSDVDGGGWRAMSSAPRDGRIIELRNTYGAAPWYGLHRWMPIYEGGECAWVSVNDPQLSACEKESLSWRHFPGDSSRYVDPTRGAQDSSEYWRGAVAAGHGLPLDYFEKDRNFWHAIGRKIIRLFSGDR
jgi:hypothetical protein